MSVLISFLRLCIPPLCKLLEKKRNAEKCGLPLHIFNNNFSSGNFSSDSPVPGQYHWHSTQTHMQVTNKEFVIIIKVCFIRSSYSMAHLYHQYADCIHDLLLFTKVRSCMGFYTNLAEIFTDVHSPPPPTITITKQDC